MVLLPKSGPELKWLETHLWTLPQKTGSIMHQKDGTDNTQDAKSVCYVTTLCVTLMCNYC